MDLERIERALREGPMDEPIYVPGAFRRARPSPWWLALAAAAVGAAVVIGLVIGIGLDVLRSERVGTPPNAEALAAELQGRWVSDAIPLDVWVDELVSQGYDPNDLGNFLTHDPFEETVEYVLIFEGSRLSMQAIYDGRAPVVLSGGEYGINRDGSFEFVEAVDLPPVVGEACRAVAEVELDDDRMQFDVLDLPGCGVDPAIAHTAFFDLAPYSRADP
ncbi:MAG: hypothetical protein M3153_07535 [Chloroflexota bacterium]|nr:hypothetical protein [Chloroflexota bacterium]